MYNPRPSSSCGALRPRGERFRGRNFGPQYVRPTAFTRAMTHDWSTPCSHTVACKARQNFLGHSLQPDAGRVTDRSPQYRMGLRSRHSRGPTACGRRLSSSMRPVAGGRRSSPRVGPASSMVRIPAKHPAYHSALTHMAVRNLVAVRGSSWLSGYLPVATGVEELRGDDSRFVMSTGSDF